MRRNNSGITLIALVITIIVLLILAGITIASLTGENGLLSRASDAKNDSANAQVKERIQLAYHSAFIAGNGSYTKDSLEEELEKEFGINNFNVDDSDNMYWILSSQGQDIEIPAGKTTPEGKLSEEQLKTKILQESENCMIDEYGKIIPMGVWNYALNEGDTTAVIQGNWYYDDDDCENYFTSNAYSGNIINGQLEYEIPVFIKISNKTYRVTELGYFSLARITLDSIKIPSTINQLDGESFAWSKISNLDIPGTVKTIYSSFRFFEGNIILEEGIERLEYSFSDSKITSITIPSSVMYLSAYLFGFYTNTYIQSVTLKSPNNWHYSYYSGGYKEGDYSFSEDPVVNASMFKSSTTWEFSKIY